MTIVREAKDERVRKPRHLTNPRTVHLVTSEWPADGKSLCGRTKGSAWVGSPANVTLLADKWCSICFNRFWKKEAE